MHSLPMQRMGQNVCGRLLTLLLLLACFFLGGGMWASGLGGKTWCWCSLCQCRDWWMFVCGWFLTLSLLLVWNFLSLERGAGGLRDSDRVLVQPISLPAVLCHIGLHKGFWVRRGRGLGLLTGCSLCPCQWVGECSPGHYCLHDFFRR
jgi:hypothetical protein